MSKLPMALLTSEEEEVGGVRRRPSASISSRSLKASLHWPSGTQASTALA